MGNAETGVGRRDEPGELLDAIVEEPERTNFSGF
jgi:hypothetical protein